MKIGILSAANSVHTAKIANGLVLSGHDVMLLSLPCHRDDDAALCSRVKLRYLRRGGAGGYIFNAREVRQRLAGWGAEVLSAHFASGYGTLAAIAGFHPYTLSVWGSDVYSFPRKSPLHGMTLRRNLKKADMILSTGERMAKETSRYAPGRDISVTPFGVDTEIFAPALQKKEHSEIKIGFFKALKDIYAPIDLIEAFALIYEKAPDTRLLIYGDGPLRRPCEERARALGIHSRVEFFGRVPHGRVAKEMNRCDIFCAPSREESFGVAALEAMACGIPCVVSDADGFLEVSEDNVTGFTVPRGDVKALASKLLLLAGDRGLRLLMGRAGRARVLERYGFNDNLRLLADILEKAAGGCVL